MLTAHVLRDSRRLVSQRDVGGADVEHGCQVAMREVGISVTTVRRGYSSNFPHYALILWRESVGEIA